MNINLYNIFKTFFKVGTLLLGGGYVILPLLTNELVDKRKWITSEELCEFYAIGASLPGIIAANTAVFTIIFMFLPTINLTFFPKDYFCKYILNYEK